MKKLSQVVQRIWSGGREDWCLRSEPLSRTGPGSNQRPNNASPPPPPLCLPSPLLSAPPLPPHSHRIFSHYSGADRWASLCISAMHFLKSEKPIHLGQTQEEGSKKEKLQNSLFFFFLLSPTPRLHPSVIHELSEHFVSPSLIVSVPRHVPWLQPVL